MNGRPGLPVREWKTEQAKLTAERFSLCEDYYRLKDETRSMEILRRGAENIIRENTTERTSERNQVMIR
ncbi:MAG: hypothetical protein LBL96_02845 [Clostridiales bacterium]|jgi:hypothetical protein|nr:hypothetical protein [Clostridiales bacterium]